MKRFSLFCLLVGLLAGTALAQFIQNGGSAAREMMKDSEGHLLKMDFTIPLAGVSDQGMQYSLFANRPLLIYFFSPKCVHCQNNYPAFQQLAREYETKGIYSIAVALGSVRKNDVRTFMDELGVSIPVFQDESMKFSSLYGTGRIPVMYLILPDGTIYRYSEMTSQAKNTLISDMNALTSGK
ncbi:MAG: TlpA family protein disulfide reductase [Fibrobacter sp.]|jgi:peroxiredoxin|nr:TlpA family protein disulfide reductase [Fibrobacter sp.]